MTKAKQSRAFRVLALALAGALLALCAGCGAQAGAGSTSAADTASASVTEAGSPGTSEASDTDVEAQAQVYLYGEYHSNTGIVERELELWREYYAQGMRHLFVELPYYDAEFLNLWMQAEDDTLLDIFFQEIEGTQGSTELMKEFYRTIKREMPETVFHGNDVGHQYWSSGQRYLDMLRQQGQEDSAEYRRAEEVMRQGAMFYTGQSEDLSEEYRREHFKEDEEQLWEYRENCMAQNFIWEFDQLAGESVMGIYGGAHVPLDGIAYYTESLPCMGNQLGQHYGAGMIYAEVLSAYFAMPEMEPLSVETLTVAGKEYTASYFGEEDISEWSDAYQSRQFWRLEDAYADFKDNALTGQVLPVTNYPMRVRAGEVFAILYTGNSGMATWQYFRADGNTWNNLPTTEQFQVEN